ncbi:hypothetical protein TNCV_1410751 [Trichonephila clavipes]|nr:hypothetical protein TNCV_1410751 [Trichonephila clavipes]
MRCTLNRLISPKSKLASRQKVLLYKAILRPIMLYASPIWAAAAVTHLKKLHTFSKTFNCVVQQTHLGLSERSLAEGS